MQHRSHSTIQSQVRLPFSVALEVVLQGIRIRMGRSIVTMMGVVLGVAFLMSVFSANAIREGISEETQLRQEVQRMLSFLEAETGPVRGRTLAIIATGELSTVEQRLLLRLQNQGVQALKYYKANAAGTVPDLAAIQTQQSPAGIGTDASGLLLVGAGDRPALDWAPVLTGMRQRVLASTRTELLAETPPGITPVRLERQLREDEIARIQEQAQQTKIRNIWIISIALMVTVIGITNSLLMSVTERFKEIGTMKCLGALSSFIRRLFFIESALTGLVGSVIGGVVGYLIAAIIYAFTFGFGLVFFSVNYGSIFGLYLIAVACGVFMSILAAIYPASFASRMVPATALRTNI